MTVLYLVPWASCPTYRVKTQSLKRIEYHYLTSISSDVAFRALLPLLFLRSLSSPTVNIRSCLQE